MLWCPGPQQDGSHPPNALWLVAACHVVQHARLTCSASLFLFFRLPVLPPRDPITSQLYEPVIIFTCPRCCFLWAALLDRCPALGSAGSSTEPPSWGFPPFLQWISEDSHAVAHTPCPTCPCCGLQPLPDAVTLWPKATTPPTHFSSHPLQAQLLPPS